MMEPGGGSPSLEALQWAKALIGSPLTPELAADVIEVMRRGPDDRTELAAWALGFAELPRRFQPKVVEALCDVLADRTRPVPLRAQAAESLGQQLEYSARRKRPRVVAANLLIEMLEDPSEAVRFWSAFALGKLQSVAALPALQRLTTDETPVAGWWTVGEEAADAIETIAGRTPPDRDRRGCAAP